MALFLERENIITLAKTDYIFSQPDYFYSLQHLFKSARFQKRKKSYKFEQIEQPSELLDSNLMRKLNKTAVIRK